MKTIFGWILSTIVAILVFCLGIILIPMQTKTIEKLELSYIFVDEYGNEYDIFEPIHGAATDWSFLFDDEKQDEENSIINKEIPPKTGYLTDITDNKIEEKDLEEEFLQEKLDEMSTGINLDNLINEIDDIKDNAKDDIKDNIKNEYKNCVTPWNTILKHGESIIAYEQRKDVPTICNAQKRICNDGNLNGTYLQGACSEEVEYTYTKVKVISYNNKNPGVLVQNPGYAKNDGAEFDTHGKINSSTQNPQTTWNNSIKDGAIKDPDISLGNKGYYNCVSPWGDSIQHGQFVKAYKTPIGFTDDLCQVELRLCLDGNLNGAFVNKSCEYMGVSSQDYREGNVDVTKPSQELIEEISKENPNKKGFRGWLKGWFG
ncbi:MAG: hypothetical protein M0P94_02180 [Candidatus Absconditabacterales bacterium]|nr:hypothetical protein [Candidatus Absconditabacterales bacterium]